MNLPTLSLRGARTLAAITFAAVVAMAASPSLGAVAAQIEVKGVTPRDVAASPTDIFDEVASGLEAVGLGQKVYLEAETEDEALISDYQWSIISRPSGSSASLSAATGPLTTFRPDRTGVFVVRLTPLDGGGSPGAMDTASIYVNTYVGAGVINTHETPTPRAPQCGTGFCHGGSNGNPDLNVSPEWIQSNHAQVLEFHMNGERSNHYSTSCLSCHTVGFNAAPSADNGGFDDVAEDIDYDLEQIPHLVEEAFNTSTDNFPQLPAELQNLASVQCESCHGPGSSHPAFLTESGARIAGVNLEYKQCAQCHDSATGFQQGFYQWSTSAHPVTQEVSEGHVTEIPSCLKCHTGEGFVAVQVEDESPPFGLEEYSGATCSTCHDPHYSDNAHQLRIAGAYTFDSGDVAEEPGLGGLCMRCHSGRVSDADETALGSFRGVHHSNQGDMLMGINGNAFGMSFDRSSAHIRVVDNTCVDCHMADPTQSGPGVITPPAVGGHTFAMRDAMGTPDEADDEINVANACADCHEELDTFNRTARGDFDGDGEREGVQSEVSGLLELLRPGILANFPGTEYDEEHGNISIGNSDFPALADNQKRALYNYNYVVNDGSLGVHNTSYAVQLLQRSYLGVYGRLITEDYPDIVLRGPVFETDAGAAWMLYE